MSEQNTSLNKEIQRREFIFKLLDEMKTSGERISADKLAKKAKMGKQTVLPHYNEWRFLDESERQSDAELPEDLVRVLKRGLMQWRIADAEQQRAFEEQANKEIDDLQELVTRLSDDLAKQKEAMSQLQEQHEESRREILNKQAELTKVRESRVELEARYQSEIQKTETITAQITELKQEHQATLASQEKKLDSQYQGQINHWMKMLDNERRLRSDLESKLDQQKSLTQSVEKERNDLEYRLEAKSRAYLDACEERNQLRKQSADVASLKAAMNEMALVLNEPLDHLTSRVRALVETQQRCNSQIENIPALEKKIAQLEQQVEASKKIEIELEKQKGYREAMEKALEKALAKEQQPKAQQSGKSGE